LLVALLACDTLIAYLIRFTPAALRATPSRGRNQQPGKAGSAVPLDGTRPISENQEGAR
jgi:hypothetical protein